MHTTKFGRKYSDSEWQEAQSIFAQEKEDGDAFLAKYEEAIKKAAGFLNREFPDVEIARWATVLRNPERAQFTDDSKENRFDAALRWVNEQAK